MNILLGFFGLLSIGFAGLPSTGLAQTNTQAPRCFGEQFSSEDTSNLYGIAQSEASRIIEEVSSAVGLTADQMTIVNCSLVENAVAWVPPEGSSVPKARYIAYNEDWLRLAAGNNRWQAIAVFGHELGHFAAGHFSENAGLSMREKERQADRYAGCAVARLGGPWMPVYDLMARIRTKTGGQYPSLDESLERAVKGFISCGNPNPEWPRSWCRGPHFLITDSDIYEGDCKNANNFCQGAIMKPKSGKKFVDCI